MRRDLNVVALAITSMVVVAFVVPLGLVIRSQTADRALSVAQSDAQAVASAFAVGATTSSSDSDLAKLGAEVLETFGRPGTTSVVLPEGTVIGASITDTPNLQRAREGVAFTARTVGGTEVLVPITLSAGRRAVVRSFVSSEDSTEGVFQASVLLGLLGLSLISAGVFLADRLGRSVVEPVLRVAGATRQFSAGDRGTRLPVEGPTEVAQVSAAFNELADELDNLLKMERESVADLSHRLRTPLAALRLQAEVLPDPDSTALMLPEVDELERAVTELIEGARRPAAHASSGIADLVEVTRHRAMFWNVLAEEQNRAMVLDLPAQIANVHADGDELGAAIDTLLENVFSHTGSSVEFLVRVTVLTGQAVLTVADAGGGFVDHQAMHRGASGSGSTGLGLDIVRRCAARGGGTVEVSNIEGGGARVDLRLPTITLASQ